MAPDCDWNDGLQTAELSKAHVAANGHGEFLSFSNKCNIVYEFTYREDPKFKNVHFGTRNTTGLMLFLQDFRPDFAEGGIVRRDWGAS